ncbi:conserved hypothetical protein [Rippkaea orientalis PCC 8801]|uniref:CusB-like beta-barrel domain-containing protein n=1 Tax=Rippkaea orientalis (strain PCC 8801 / RF-1) TaxID=41431 RepID=B7JX30_RIPO1|nr:efflux RND transporter periplasmic adaptor subunit [Rippkaea orientalis]ACK65879.1 conserved hypothetical protein [Rippkaea orientalis PCC 8801]
MLITHFNRLRKDLIITTIADHQTSAKRYLIKDPRSQETFEFREEEYFLCQLMDGVTSVPEILAAFEKRFQTQLTEADYQNFAQEIESLNLLESYNSEVQPTEQPIRNGQTNPSTMNGKKSHSSKMFVWKVRNPEAFFGRLVSWTKPYHRFLKLSPWLLIPLLVIALITFFNHLDLFWNDLNFFGDAIPFIVTYIANIVLLNGCGRLIQATIFTAYRGQPSVFGITLVLGFIPRFQVKLQEYQSASRQAQLWIYGAPLLLRLFVFSLGVIFWYATRTTGTALPTLVLVLAHTALSTFLFVSFPLLSGYGHYFLIAALGLPNNFLSQSQKASRMLFWGGRLPSFLSTKQKILLVGVGLASNIAVLIMLFLFINYFAQGITKTFPQIFGPQTGLFVLFLFLIIGLIQLIPRLDFGGRKAQVSSRSSVTFTNETPLAQTPLTASRKRFSAWLNTGVKILLLVGLIIWLSLPYQTKPGGTLQLLTPRQIDIQAQVSGKSQIIRVMFPGGNEQLIPAGTVIAQMKDIDLENEIETLGAEIDKAKSTLQSRQSDLDKLLATPRKEDIQVARDQVKAAQTEVETAKKAIAIAQKNLEVTEQQIQSALTEANFYIRETVRLEEGYQEGAIALSLVEDAQRQAETKKIEAQEKRALLLRQQQEVEQARSQLATAQENLQISQSSLELVLSGPYDDDVEAARHDVATARADLERLNKQQRQSQDKLKLTTLVMPLNGYLVTPYLETKVGTYLEQGDTFAVAEDATSILAEVQVPEYDVGQFSTGKKVAVKLAAYPNETITGKVVAITPSASEETTETSVESGRYLQVLVEIPYSGRILKTGMTGYAKIEGQTKPMIVAFTTPMVRFFQIEVWSWLP